MAITILPSRRGRRTLASVGSSASQFAWIVLDSALFPVAEISESISRPTLNQVDIDMSKSKERIIPPTKKVTSTGGKALPKGNPMAGRVLADASAANKQGVKRGR